MVQLGKFVKGKAPSTTDQKRTFIKIRHQDKGIEDLDQEQKQMKMRRDYLKNAMYEEQKMANFNRMKILTHWRKIMRVAKTEQLKKEM